MSSAATATATQLLAVTAATAALSVTTEEIQPPTAEGCLVWRKYSELALHGGLRHIVKYFHDLCQSDNFVSHASNFGFTNPSFHPNEGNLQEGNFAFDRIANCLETTEAELISSEACLGLVFHGTAEASIPNILKNGLDPKRRAGQAYGAGEYFSKEPTISLSYCRGGMAMVVFVVILPSKQHPQLPEDYVVVENNCHQIPLGALKFTKVDQQVLSRSHVRRSEFRKLSADVFAKSQAAEETRIKANIIQNLISGKTDCAADCYTRKGHLLKAPSKKEISWYAHQKIDPEVMFFYFPDLPEPMTLQELDDAKIPSVDDAVLQELESKRLLEQARQLHEITGPQTQVT